MLLVADVKKDKHHTMTKDQEKLFGIDKLNVPRSEVPAITCRLFCTHSTVHRDTNYKYHALTKFKKRPAVLL